MPEIIIHLPLYPFLTHSRRIKPLCRPGFHCLLFYLQGQRTEKEREGDSGLSKWRERQRTVRYRGKERGGEKQERSPLSDSNLETCAFYEFPALRKTYRERKRAQFKSLSWQDVALHVYTCVFKFKGTLHCLWLGNMY